MGRFYEMLVKALEEEEPFALGIICGVKGSSPQKTGAKAIFFADGRIYGTLGGGCLEAEIQDRARRALQNRTSATFELVLDHDFGWDDGLICGGAVEGLILPRAAEAAGIWRELARGSETRAWGVKKDFTIAWCDDREAEWWYQETVAPPVQLWVAGSGHIAQAVVPLALRLDFEVTVFDDRPFLANPQFFPEPTRFRVDSWEKLLAEPMPRQPLFGLIVTRGHQHDAMVLHNWVRRPFVFLGMIGSRRKKRLIFNKFMEEGLATAEQLAKVACPVGLDIQAVGVHEIAVSILAQMIQCRAQLLNPGRASASSSSEPGRVPADS